MKSLQAVKQNTRLKYPSYSQLYLLIPIEKNVLCLEMRLPVQKNNGQGKLGYLKIS